MKHLIVCPLVLALGFGNPAFAQIPNAPATSPALAAVVDPSATTSVPKPDASGKYVLREGEDVHLRFAEDLSSKTSSDGDPIALILDDDLKVGNVIVAKAGSKAVGEVTSAKKAGMMGKAGELNMRLDYVKVGDSKIKLRGVKGKEGESGVTSTVVLTVLFGPIGLIKHGKNVDIKQGTALKAFVADDIALLPVL